MQSITDLQLDLFDACYGPPPFLDREIYNGLEKETQAQLVSFTSQPEPEEEFEWTDEGIYRICVAVIERALMDLKSTHEELSELRRESISWIFDDTVAPFSFKVCCYEAALDPDLIRQEVRELAIGKHIIL